jgi:uncharacterized protein YyaL (SSP411 family)
MDFSMQNNLIEETSPYLLQHAHNPVDWFPWGDAAIAKARREDKPILLSIGYAACHWCHVMAHESFEDQETADLMNELFVNIKVDREERPDLDKIYQTTHALLTQRSGGWPLTVFLSADSLTPFFSGTYFPLRAHNQMPPFKDVLLKIDEIYRLRQDDVLKQNESLQNVLQKTTAAPLAGIELTDAPLHSARLSLQNTFDPVHGGFGDAPKFPHPIMLEFLLQEKSPMVLKTLLCMGEGGLYDQLRGGFFRYSVDVNWEIPHFEKMLYDNAQLLFLYALASREFDEAHFADVAAETAQWVIAEMQAPDGGYYSSLDADSEGHEGKYYVWNKSQIETLLSGEEFQMTKIYFGLDAPANFDDQWHLHIFEALKTPQEKSMLASAKQKLLASREQRSRPHRDEKILTAWNALMIKGMLVAGDILKKPEFTQSANKALQFIELHLWKDGQLASSFKDEKIKYPGYLDDYAYLLDALMTAMQISADQKLLVFAKQIADTMLKHFYDPENGGFFFTPDNHEKLLYRPKTMMDESIPAGNGVAVRALLALARMTGNKDYAHTSEKTLILAWPLLANYPAEHASVLLGLKDFLPAKV